MTQKCSIRTTKIVCQQNQPSRSFAKKKSSAAGTLWYKVSRNWSNGPVQLRKHLGNLTRYFFYLQVLGSIQSWNGWLGFKENEKAALFCSPRPNEPYDQPTLKKNGKEREGNIYITTFKTKKVRSYCWYVMIICIRSTILVAKGQ